MSLIHYLACLCFLIGTEIELPPVKIISISYGLLSVQKAVIHDLRALGLLLSVERNNPQITSFHQIYSIIFTFWGRLLQV